MEQLKTVNIKGKNYVEVAQRIKAFRSMPEYKGFSLETEIVAYDDLSCILKAIIKDPNGRVIATGLAQEDKQSSMINKTSFFENCETSAWGRALGNLGIGVDCSICSAEEVEMAIAKQEQQTQPTPKKPVPRKPVQQQVQQFAAPNQIPQEQMPQGPVTQPTGLGQVYDTSFKANNDYPWLSDYVIAGCQRLGIDINKYAAYKKVAVEQLTDAMLQEAIHMKSERMNQNGQQANI